MKFLIFINVILFGALLDNRLAPQQSDEQIILEVLKKQTECWNKGDIDCFMQSYWKSEKMMFIGKNGITYGWDQTLNNYKTRYPDRQTMGELKFEILETNKISSEAYFMVGKFHLTRIKEIGDAEGYFSLLFRKINGQWFIVSDHTSA